MAIDESTPIKKRVDHFLTEAQKHRTKADEHNDGIFLIIMVFALVADLFSLLAPFLGPLVFFLPILSGMIVAGINLFFLWYRKNTIKSIDQFLLIVGAPVILEFLPIISALPFASLSVAMRWSISAQAAGIDRGSAEEFDKLAAKEQKKILRIQQASRAALFISAGSQIDTQEEEEDSAEAA